MVETYEPTPFKDRPSQNVGLRHYWKEIAPILGLSALGAGGGWLLGKMRSSPNPGAYAAFGGKITGIISAFLIWKKKEKEHVGIEEVYKELKTVEHMHVTDEDLERDNRILNKMIEFEKRKKEKAGDSFVERTTEKETAPNREI